MSLEMIDCGFDTDDIITGTVGCETSPMDSDLWLKSNNPPDDSEAVRWRKAEAWSLGRIDKNGRFFFC